MDLTGIKEYLGEDWRRTLSCMKDMLASDIDLLDRTNESILSVSGKQMRPVLSLLVARASMAYLGKTGELPHDCWRYAAASELLHNATLLHDDVADESDQRRGRPTVNSLMGPSVSVLVGDYWLVRAVDCILDAEVHSDDVVRVFAKTLGDLAKGEMFQLQKAGSGDTTEEDYLRIIYGKTATLFEATARAAVIGVGGDAALQDRMAGFAVKLGLAFQIRDDILDYSLDLNIGKPVGADILERKMTLPLLGAFRNVPAEKEAEVRRMISDIEAHPENRDAIVGFVKANGGIVYAQDRLCSFVDGALDDLDALPKSKDREYLEAFARYVGDRII